MSKSISVEKEFKIVIGSENITYRNNVASALRLQGFSVEFCTGGFHLLNYLENFEDISLVILHENMADMGAAEMISLVRTQKNKIELPVLFISKKQHAPADIQEIIMAGANEFIVQLPGFQSIIDKTRKYYNLLQPS